MPLPTPFRTLSNEITSRFCMSDSDPSMPVVRQDLELESSQGAGSRAARIAELVDDRLRFDGPLESLAAPLLDLHHRIVAAIVEARPLPDACLFMPELDHFVAECQTSWNAMAEGVRVDPDLDGWRRVLLSETEAAFIGWCFSCLCEISGGGLVRIDGVHAGDDAWSEHETSEFWITPEPELLAADLRSALKGGPVVMAADPLRQRFKSAI
jgi:hypothetical protein